jgi:hypothetical protein
LGPQILSVGQQAALIAPVASLKKKQVVPSGQQIGGVPGEVQIWPCLQQVLPTRTEPGGQRHTPSKQIMPGGQHLRRFVPGTGQSRGPTGQQPSAVETEPGGQTQ